MQAVNIRELKKNPSAAIRQANIGSPVLVTKRDKPEALLVGIDAVAVPDPAMLRLGLAISLYRDAAISLGAAARMAGQPLADFLSLLAERGISVTGEADELEQDLDVLDRWLNSSPS